MLSRVCWVVKVIYEFAMLVTWIAFSYKDWSIIHKELGRFVDNYEFTLLTVSYFMTDCSKHKHLTEM